MEKAQATWQMYFASVCSLRLHPRNKQTGDDFEDEVEFAARVADRMMKETDKRWHG